MIERRLSIHTKSETHMTYEYTVACGEQQTSMRLHTVSTHKYTTPPIYMTKITAQQRNPLQRN